MGLKAIRNVAEYALCFRRVGSNVGEDRCPYCKDAVYKGYWPIVCRVVRVGFGRVVDELCCVGAPFLGCVAVFGHEME
jgi:hypothetical protein